MTGENWVRLTITVSFMFLCVSTSADPKRQLTNDQIAKMLIEESISTYPGVCACPYSTMKSGRSCGGRSAYSKKGGYAPLCYREDKQIRR